MPRTAIVTGSSRGIGRAIALYLGKQGFNVIVNYANKADEAHQAVQEIEKSGGKAIAVQGNVASVADATKLFDQAQETYGGIDVLVNNAGVMTVKNIADATDDDYNHMLDINLKGSFNMMRLAAKRLRDNGRIINFSTTALYSSMPGYGIYNATKGAIEAITKVLCKELAPRKITVNAVAPGPVATELFLDGKSQELLDRLTKMIPLGRLGEVEDIAPIVAFLASPESGWINGQTIRANGGIG